MGISWRRARAARARVLAATAVAASLGLGSAATADASVDLGAGSRTVVESEVVAGWQAAVDSPGAPTELTATITVPTLACTSEDTGVVTSVGMVEIPYRFAGARIYAACDAGDATFEARMASSTTGELVVEEDVAAGDRIVISATWDGSVQRPSVIVTISDLDRGWRAETTYDFIADGFNAAVVRQVPLRVDGEALPVSDYSGATVQRARLAGEGLGEARPTKYVLVDADGDRVVVPSKIRSGTRFTFKRTTEDGAITPR